MEPDKKMADGSIPSPEGFVPQAPAFDYDKQRDETTLVAVRNIYQVFGTYSSLMCLDMTATQADIDDAEETLCTHILEVIVNCKVPDAEMQTLIATMQSKTYKLFEKIAKLKEKYEREILARTIGTNDPGTGLLSREQATFGDMLVTLTELRKAQDEGGISRYFPQRTDAE